MSRSSFGVGPCRFCEKMVSSCGYGEWNHLRKHYREVFEKEPARFLGVTDLTGAILRWQNGAIDKARLGEVY